jgi:hypothetical protein
MDIRGIAIRLAVLGLAATVVLGTYLDSDDVFTHRGDVDEISYVWKT